MYLQYGIFLLLIGYSTFTKSQVIRSPCPEQFQYGIQNERNTAFFETIIPRSQIEGFNVSFEFFIPNNKLDSANDIEINLNETEMVKKIFLREKVEYKIIFQNNHLPLFRILLSGNVVCRNKEVHGIVQQEKIVAASYTFNPEADQITEVEKIAGQGVNEVGCGDLNHNFSSLSIGGEKTEPSKWPWAASLRINGEPICSATLISKAVAVSAAHCLKNGQVEVKSKDVTLRLYDNTDATIWRYNIHSKFNGPGGNDIALLHLTEDIVLKEFVPVCVWPYYDKIENQKGTLVGFGQSEFRVAGTINQIDLITVSSQTCAESHRYLKKLVNENTFCAKGPTGTGPCKGDSGGGLVFNFKGIWYLRGVVSTSLLNEYNECDTNNYAVFMNIEKYFEWIKDIPEGEKLRSPCPSVFKYGLYDGRNAGFFETYLLRSEIGGFNVSLEFVLPNDTPSNENDFEINLVHDEEEIARKIFVKERIKYKIIFPKSYLPLYRILISGIVVCENKVEIIENPKVVAISDAFTSKHNQIADVESIASKDINQEGCGNLNLNFTALSIGGEKTEQSRWPWAVLLRVNFEYKCSATLISKSVAVSAAHCLKYAGAEVESKDITLRLYDNTVVNIWHYNIHSNFEAPGVNDIALLYLEQDVTLVEFVPVCIRPYYDKIKNQKATLVSYGQTEFRDAGTINQLNLTMASSEACAESHKDLKKVVNENTFCAKGIAGTGPCQGDNGAGLVFNLNGIWYLRGVFSVSLENEYNECDTNNYAVFMNIEKYYDWLKKIPKTGELRSPCPVVFQYGLQDGWKAGFFEAYILRSQIKGFNVSLEFAVPNGTPSNENYFKINLVHDKKGIARKIFLKERISYEIIFLRSYFPLYRIYISGNVVCENKAEIVQNSKVIAISHAYTNPDPTGVVDLDALMIGSTGKDINEESCGNLNLNFSVLSIGGENTEQLRWPWAVSLHVNGEYKCSATLITKAVAVSAAQCLKYNGVEIKPEDITLKLYDNTDAAIWEYNIHSKFNGPGVNDIALLYLEHDVTLVEFVPVCVWPYYDRNENQKATLVSFGQTEFRDDGIINKLDLTMVSSETCAESDKDLKRLVNENTICAKGLIGSGPCQADTGGGLVFNLNGIWYLRGVFSTSLINDLDDCDTNNYAVFMNIPSYFDWITNTNNKRKS